ncbi:unnamed protein product, partial [Meganyctiphanes norvegica]
DVNMQQLASWKFAKHTCILIGVALIVFLIYATTSNYNFHTYFVHKAPYNDIGLNVEYNIWKPFTSKPRRKQDWYVAECFNGEFNEDLEIIFSNHIPTWESSNNLECMELYARFSTLYEIHDRYSGKMSLPGPFAARVSDWLQGNKELIDSVHHQHLIHVYSPLTSEHTVYNPVRAKRPMPTKKMDVFAWVDKLANDTAKDCDFCLYSKQTAADKFGRYETSDSARVSNTFKVEKWHGMLVTRNHHHPIKIPKDLFVRFLEDSMIWIYQVVKEDPDYIYSNLAWDTLHHAGASQIHPHIHMMMSPDHYYGFFENLRTAGQRYHNAMNENYFNTIVEIHSALGLVVQYRDAVAVAIINGKTDMEVMLLSDFPSKNLYTLLHYTLEAYHKEFEQLCHSVTAAWPPLGMSSMAERGRIPAIIRVASRGDCSSLRTDISSYEIYQIVYRNHDPWQVARAIRRTIAKVDPEWVARNQYVVVE